MVRELSALGFLLSMAGVANGLYNLDRHAESVNCIGSEFVLAASQRASFYLFIAVICAVLYWICSLAIRRAEQSLPVVR